MTAQRRASAAGVLLATGLALVVEPAHAGKDPVAVLIYDGFGTTRRARVGGRVLEDEGLDRPSKKESWARRVRRSVNLFESDEIPHARVEIRVAGRKVRAKADEEGLFMVELRGPLKAGAHKVTARLLEPTGRRWRAITGTLHVAPAKPGLAVISDIDDTVLHSEVTKKRKLLWRVLTANPHKLHTFSGAPQLFTRLQRRGAALAFVSGSPINLYPRLQQFFALRKFPRAPLLLKNLGASKKADSLLEQRAYKLRQIARVQRLLPGYRLVLIGDSGEKDPEVYAEVKRRDPKSVAAILIHRVTDEPPGAPRFSGQIVFSRYAEATHALERLGLLEPAPAKPAPKEAAPKEAAR